MTGSLTRNQAIVLGLVVLVALGLAAAGLFAVGDREGLWAEQFALAARFPQISGVEIGATVRVQGINAGQVEDVEQPAQRGGDVVLHLRLKSRFRPLIGSDAQAMIVSEGLIGGKVVEIDPGTPRAAPIAPGAVLPGRADNVMEDVKRLAGKSRELMAEVQGLTAELRQGQGVIGKEVIGSLRQFQQTMQAMERGFDGLKNMPFVGKYVDASTALLVRPTAERHPFVFREADLFEPGRAVLTPEGRGRLDALVTKEFPRLKVSDSEIVIAAYAGSGVDARAAEILTQQQSEAVREYLLEKHQVHKLGWWRSRDLLALGMGTKPSPTEPPGSIPPARRIEVLVFVPPGSVKEK